MTFWNESHKWTLALPHWHRKKCASWLDPTSCCPCYLDTKSSVRFSSASEPKAILQHFLMLLQQLLSRRLMLWSSLASGGACYQEISRPLKVQCSNRKPLPAATSVKVEMRSGDLNWLPLSLGKSLFSFLMDSERRWPEARRREITRYHLTNSNQYWFGSDVRPPKWWSHIDRCDFANWFFKCLSTTRTTPVPQTLVLNKAAAEERSSSPASPCMQIV